MQIQIKDFKNKTLFLKFDGHTQKLKEYISITTQVPKENFFILKEGKIIDRSLERGTIKLDGHTLELRIRAH